MNTQTQQLRALTRGLYSIQAVRIKIGNTLCAAFRSKLGLKPPEPEETDKDAKKVLDALRASFKKITDGVKRELPTLTEFKGDEIISTYTELCLVSTYLTVETDEAKHFRRLEIVLETQGFPIYTDYLRQIKGCGPAMSAVLISEIDIHKAQYPSSLWKFAGLDVAADGAGRSRRKEHLVRVKYKNKKGVEDERDSVTFNPRLKTKLTGVLVGCLIKCGNERYRGIYDNYKHRLETMPQHVEKSKGHRHSMASRYVAKIFLQDLYNAWRPMEGLPVAPTYFEAKSGRSHSEAA